jgi:hypothetical protein
VCPGPPLCPPPCSAAAGTPPAGRTPPSAPGRGGFGVSGRRWRQVLVLIASTAAQA